MPGLSEDACQYFADAKVRRLGQTQAVTLVRWMAT